MMPWDRPAPEKEGRPSAWALLPEDLAAMGVPGRPEHLFARLQRVKSWKDGAPWLSREARAWFEAHTDLSLPAPDDASPSADGSTKLALSLSDAKRIEAVHMPPVVRPTQHRPGCLPVRPLDAGTVLPALYRRSGRGRGSGSSRP